MHLFDLFSVNGTTPLHVVCEFGHLTCIRMLIEGGADVNARDEDGDAPLNVAAIRGNVDIIRLLASYKQCDVNVQGSCLDRTPLHNACDAGDHVACIHELMSHGADVEARDDHSGSTPLMLAAAHDHTECTKALIDDYNASINATDKHGTSALCRAAFNGCVRMVRTLTSYAHCDVNLAEAESGRTALHYASKEGNVECIHELMKAGADLEAKDSVFHATPLFYAVKMTPPGDQTSGDLMKCIEVFINSYGASVNATAENGNTALHYAVINRHLEVAKMLTSFSECDVNAANLSGYTALHAACSAKDKPCCQLLLSCGANTDACDNDDNVTPLHVAASENAVEVVKLLVEEGNASVNAVERNVGSALHLAVERDFVELVDVLAAYEQCDVNCRGSSKGSTPLHLACMYGSVPCASVLIRHGASVSVKDDAEITPLQISGRALQ